MDEDERERLQLVIASSNQTVDEEGGSADPVAQRRVVDALVRKARALDRLGRAEERIRVWDEIVQLFADDPPPGQPLIALQAAAAKAFDLRRLGRLEMALEVADTVVDGCALLDRSDAVVRLAARALAIKRDTLAQIGRESEALRVDDEIVARFFDSEQPDVRGYVNRALLFKSRALWRGNRVEDAVAISRLTATRLETEPKESLPELVHIVLSDLMRLMRISRPNRQGVAWTIFVAAVNLGSVTLRRMTARLTGPDSLPALSTPGIQDAIAPTRSLASGGMRKRLTLSRQRVGQALAMSQAVISRLDGADDPELQKLAAVAQIAQGMALFVLGHPRNAARILERTTKGGAPRGNPGLAAGRDDARRRLRQARKDRRRVRPLPPRRRTRRRGPANSAHRLRRFTSRQSHHRSLDHREAHSPGSETATKDQRRR